MNTRKESFGLFRVSALGLVLWSALTPAAASGLPGPDRPAKAAKVDTINTRTLRLAPHALKAGKSTYAVYFEDSTGRRLGSADLWDREISLRKDEKGQPVYQFSWKWYSRDSLRASVTATGDPVSLQPYAHQADYGRRGQFAYTFADNVVTVPDDARRTRRDSTFRVVLNPPAFYFPMDLEIFPLLPFRAVNQQFALAFYEPGTPQSAYYRATVTGRENLATTGGASVACWLLRMDYAPGSYATFWISDKTREVVKMKEYFRGRYRYKVRLY